MRTIAYLLYGSRREYHLELTYSVLSATHFLGSDQTNYRIVLITNTANRRFDLPVEHLMFSPDEFRRWTRSETYMHEAKIHALVKALDCFGGSVALIDTDTYFLDHPRKLFERVSAGKSVMHSFEGTLQQFQFWRPLLERVTAPVAGYRVARDSEMLNSGVVAVDFSDRHVLDDLIPLVGELHDIHPIFNIEQFAFASVLRKHTQVAVCADIVYHYWSYEREFFHAQIGELFPRFSSELFAQHVNNLPRLGYPTKRRSDQVRAMVVSLFRRGGDAYRFAYLAYLCAFRLATVDALNACVWARIALMALRNNGFPVRHVKRDFKRMRYAESYPWLVTETKREWIRYWESLDALD